MTGVIIKRKCENCNNIVDQRAFFKEQDGKVTLERWLEFCPFCKHPLKKPTEEEFDNALLINIQVAQNQSAIMNTQLMLTSEIGTLTKAIEQTRESYATECANLRQFLDGFLSHFAKMVSSLENSSKSFKKSMDEHLALIGVFNEGMKKLMKESGARTKEVVKALNRLENTFKAAVDEATKDQG